MKIIVFLCGVAFSRPTARDDLNEILKAMDQVYSWKIVNYYGEYAKGLAQVDESSVEIAFEFTDKNNDMKISKDELIRSAFQIFLIEEPKMVILTQNLVIIAFKNHFKYDEVGIRIGFGLRNGLWDNFYE